MNVFLDSDLILRDPYFKSTHHQLLLELARKNQITLYMTETGLVKVKNKYRSKINSLSEELKGLWSTFQTLIHDDSEKIFTPLYVKTLSIELDHFLQNLMDESVIKVVPYYSNIIPNESDLNINQTEKLHIWMSYLQYIQTHNIHRAYFITDNHEVSYLLKQYDTNSTINVLENIKKFLNQCIEIYPTNNEFEFSTIAERNVYVTNLINFNYHEQLYNEIQKSLSSRDTRLPHTFMPEDMNLLAVSDIKFKMFSVNKALIEGNLFFNVEEPHQNNPSFAFVNAELNSVQVSTETMTKYKTVFALSLNNDLEPQKIEITNIEVC
jgi:hypothetical protein